MSEKSPCEIVGSMKGVEIARFGPPEVLKFKEMAIPSIGAGEILVRTKVLGLNFADVFARLGYYPGIPKPPFVPGIEFSGTVEAVGVSVRGVRRGDRVLGFSRQRAYAGFVAIPSGQAIGIPDSMPFEEGAAFGVTYLTAYHAMVTLAHIQRGERMLLHAAAGGVGTAALQLAHHLGVEVYATAGSPEKIAVVKEAGAVLAIDYTKEDFVEPVRRHSQGIGVDVVLDSVGGSVFRKSWDLLAPMGRYVLYGFASVATEKGVRRLRALKEIASVRLLYPPSLVTKNVSLMGFNLYFLVHKTAYLRKALKQLLRWYSEGVLRPVIGARYRFEQIQEAHHALQSRKTVGKVIVTMP